MVGVHTGTGQWAAIPWPPPQDLSATADSVICVLVVPVVATTAQHWSKLIQYSLLDGRQAPDGYLRVRGPGAQLRHASSFDPKELAVFVCDFALAG